MNEFKALFYTAAMLALAWGYTVASEQMFNREARRRAADRVAEKLESPPTTLGEWELREQGEFTSQQKSILECRLGRTLHYVHRITGDRIAVAVVLGPPGPTSVHDPTVCYPGSGSNPVGDPEKLDLELGSGRAGLWTTTMESSLQPGVRNQVYWTWHDGVRWQNPNLARVHFAASPYLVKVQTDRALAPGESDRSSTEFLKRFLDEIGRRIQA